MSEAQDYFFAVLDAELKSGKTPLNAIETATDNYAYVFEITPKEKRDVIESNIPKKPVTPLRSNEVEGKLHWKQETHDYIDIVGKVPKDWSYSTRVIIRKVE